MLDWIYAIVSMSAVIAFLGVVLVFVRELDLIIVTLLVIAVGVLYFWQELKAGGAHANNAGPGNNSDG
ncbi:MAG: hypothetical protein OEO83_16950 [Alphaproteobacteria bacterium]|nr:hypothetical protein [Alphaproteobacteria bacterium]